MCPARQFWEGAALIVTLLFLQGAEQPRLPWGYLMPGGEGVKGSIYGLLAAALSTLFFLIKHTEYSNATEGHSAQFDGLYRVLALGQALDGVMGYLGCSGHRPWTWGTPSTEKQILK